MKQSHDPGVGSSVQSGAYNSALFESFVAGVNRLDAAVGVLDLGPSTPENLMFWVRCGRDVAAFDLQANEAAERPLPLEGKRFGGILCWNALSLLPRARAQAAVAALHTVLEPGGYLFAIFDGDGRRAPAPVRYHIVSESRLRFEPCEGMPPGRAVSTSEIETLMEGLRATRLTVMRHGSREALGQIPPATRAPFPDARGLRPRAT